MWCCELTSQAWFDFIVLIFIASNCITLAMERPNIPPWSLERQILDILNHIFTVVFTIEMALKVLTLFYPVDFVTPFFNSTDSPPQVLGDRQIVLD
jgi:hypothetical protein